MPNIVRKADPAVISDYLLQLIERKRDLDFPWFPARVVCHDILGQTALVDLAGLRDTIAAKAGDPAKVNPVVPVQLIVDHSLAVGVRRLRPEPSRTAHRRAPQRRPLPLHRVDQKNAFRQRGRDPCGERDHAPDQPGKMSPVIHAEDGVAYPTPAWAPIRTRRTWTRWA